MANGAWDIPNETEEVTITLNTTNFSLAAGWGNMKGIRKGNTVYIRIYGVTPKVSGPSGTSIDLCTFSGLPAKMPAVTPFLTLAGGVAGRCAIDIDTNLIYATGFSADNVVRFCYLVFPV